jgi:ATP/maltotriose-dependent transcriptional regulator MalT
VIAREEFSRKFSFWGEISFGRIIRAVPDESANSLAAGQAALAAADWTGARTAFEAALRAADTPAAHDGLGIALWWLNDIAAAHEQRTAAYAEFKRQGDLRRAGYLAAWLAREQVFLHQNASAMNGWFARAERLLSDADPSAEKCWFDLFRASMLASPDELAAVAFRTLDLARQLGEDDLEVAALAFGGLARVAAGDVSSGMNCLDEAMAAATGGEVGNLMVVSEVFCVTLSACEMSGDWVRTEHWCRAAADYAQRYNCSFLSAYCRTTYGGLLTATGRWREAEAALTEAIRVFDGGHRGLRVHAVLKLADLRVCQGRLEEAEALVRGLEDQGAATMPLARLHLARREPELARALLEQALGSAPAPALNQAPLLLLCVDAALALGDPAGARRAAEQLAALAELAHSDLLLAQADLARGQITRDTDQADAVRHFRAALERLGQYEQSLLGSRAKLELARALKTADPPAALTWARAALATFERLGAAHEAGEAAQVLRDLGAPGRVSARAAGPLTPRETEVLALLAHGLSNREIAGRLVISAKTVEHHVSQILGKLGLRSRAEAAAYAAQTPTPENKGGE